MTTRKMSASEQRAVLSLSTIMALRMLGLFMVLPIFALYASHLEAASPTLIGLAIGIYGLFQAVFQIPFGALSDRFGRKPIIVIGLTIFVCGSLLAAVAQNMTLMIIARALQGAGAVGSTLLALMADLTTEEQRTKSMAIAGITIGFSFSLAMLLGPLLTKWISVSHIFVLSGALGCLGILLLYIWTPTPHQIRLHHENEPAWKGWVKIFSSPQLANLNLGIFILHAVFTASFIAIPLSLNQFIHLGLNRQWILYLPSLLVAFCLSLVCIGLAERQQKIKPYFLLGIVSLILAELVFWCMPSSWLTAALGIGLFFSGFSLLEAFLPSLISRTAPVRYKGTALGIFSCAQFFGIFVGGVCGGWLLSHFSFPGIYLFCFLLLIAWFILAYQSRPPHFLVTQMWPLTSTHRIAWSTLVSELQVIPGMVEVTLITEEQMLYLKMERKTSKHPDFIRLKEQLQSSSFTF